MKVDGRNDAAPARPASDKERFQKVLKKTLPEAAKTPLRGGQAARAPSALTRRATVTVGTPTGLVRTPQRSAFASSEHLGQVRQGLNAEAHRLRDVRGEAHQMNQERVQQRVTELIARELAREPRAEPMAPRPTSTSPSPETPTTTLPVEALSAADGARLASAGASGAAASEAPPPEARVQAVLELIEKLEVFVRSQRPALAMHLGGTLNATVEVERTGTREVALRIQGRRAPLPQQDVERIREALASRGLKLSAFLTS